ncbi:hypothetical protein QUF72_04515 [Desulfobacterales bacterium HSG2]|nr:hypothetical protein [Desulfobacterales bacterium HSG2]
MSFVHPDTDDYAVLFAKNESAVIAVKQDGDTFMKHIQEELTKIGIRDRIDKFGKIE